MSITMELSIRDVISLIKKLPPDELEKVKDAIIKQELYFQQYQPKPLSGLVSDFKGAGYSAEFVKDLENGLKKSSPHAR